MTIDFFVLRRERAAEGLRQNARTDYEWSFYKVDPSRRSVITHSRWWITLPFFDHLVLFHSVITPSRYFRLILRSPWQKNQWMFETLWMADLCERIRTEWMMYKVKMSEFFRSTQLECLPVLTSAWNGGRGGNNSWLLDLIWLIPSHVVVFYQSDF